MNEIDLNKVKKLSRLLSGQETKEPMTPQELKTKIGQKLLECKINELSKRIKKL